MLMLGFVARMLAFCLMVLGTGLAWGQTYPSKPIRIVTADVGGGADFVARVLAQALAAGLGQQVIVENRPGAGGAIAFETVARAAPDGYTLLLFSNGMWTLPLLQKVNYDPVKDFAPVSMIDSVPNLLVVHPSLPVKSVKDLIALAKATHSVFAPAATPRPVVTRLNEEIVRVLRTADAKEKLLKNGVDPIGSTPEQLATTVQSEMTKIGKVIKDAGIRTD